MDQIETIPDWKRLEQAWIADCFWRRLTVPVQQQSQQGKTNHA